VIEKYIKLPERKRRKDRATDRERAIAIREEKDGLIAALVLPAEEIKCREASLQDLLEAVGYEERDE
jgi:hypothetical protein